MTNINEKLSKKSIDIKGKKYILVSDRVLAFNEFYPNGSIQTKIEDDGTKVLASAKVTPDCKFPERFFTGNSQATWGDGYINKTSALENAETSAVGRALALMGIGVLDSIASVDEIKKTEVVRPYNAPQTASTSSLGLRHCHKHNVDVEVKLAKTGKPYAMHMVDGVSCFVNSEEEMDGFRERTIDQANDNIF